MKHTRALAEFVAGLKIEDVPTEVIAAAKRALLDFLGVAAFGTTTEWAGYGKQHVRRNGCPGQSTVIGTPWTASPRDAALLNGLFAHGFELDDTHVPSSSHPGCVVVPALFAAVDQEISGSRFLTAMIAGYEIMARIGAAVAPDHMGQGFHATATTGVFGSAAAVAAMLRLGEEETVAALGIAGSFCSGVTEFANDPWGDMIKRLHAGKAAESGLLATQLAATGYRGPRSILEGRQGFLQTFARRSDIRKLTRPLGQRYEIATNISFKPYACCSNLFAVIDAVKHLIATVGFDADLVREVTVFGNRDQVQYHAESVRISTVGAAQYSIPYAVAVTLIGAIDEPSVAFGNEMLCDSRIAALCRKTTVRLDPKIDALFPQCEAARVVVRLTGGKRLERMVRYAKGSPKNRLSQDELEGKFERLTRGVFQPTAATQIRATVEKLESIGDVRALLRLLGGTGANIESV